MTRHQRRWQNIAWYHRVSDKMIKHQEKGGKTSHGNTNSDKMIKLQHDNKISVMMTKHQNMDGKTSQHGWKNITPNNDIENQSRITNIHDDETSAQR